VIWTALIFANASLSASFGLRASFSIDQDLFLFLSFTVIKSVHLLSAEWAAVTFFHRPGVWKWKNIFELVGQENTMPPRSRITAPTKAEMMLLCPAAADSEALVSWVYLTYPLSVMKSYCPYGKWSKK